MNFIKRSILAVIRRKGKSVIMFIIFAAIANMVLAGLAIQHATEYAGTLAKEKLGAQLTLRFDRQSAMQNAISGGEQRPRVQTEPVTEDMAKIIAEDKNIISYNYLVNANGIADGFSPVTTDEGTQQDNTSNGNVGQGRNGNMQGADFVMPDVTVTGVYSSELIDAFHNGDSQIIDGKQITTDDSDKKVALVEKNLAEQNRLKVGSKIKIKATRADNTIEYTIVGIYTTTSSTTDNQGMKGLSFTDPYNRIYVDYKSAISLKAVSTDDGITQGGIDSAVFFVDDPKNIDLVKADAKTMNIDWNKFTLDANDAAYKQMMGPIENVASFSMTAVYIVAIAGAVILALILMLSVKERMYETGVLLSMGEGKLKIIGQYIVEALLIAVLAFGLSTVSGKFIAQGVGNMLLDREVQVVQEQSTNGNGFGNGRNFSQGQGGWLGRTSGQSYEPVDSLNIAVNTSEVGKMSVAGLLILVFGTIIPASSVMRYKPKAILTKAA